MYPVLKRMNQEMQTVNDTLRDPKDFEMLPCELETAAGRVTCPHCGHHVTTQVGHVTGKMTWIVCAALTVTCIPCCCIPFLCNTTKDVQHTCPKCNNVIAVYKIV
ncbi:unknown [Singapore grouper iridovirus]|uniref:LITAF domain-containing protein n=1 Tax=Singapore grouper iridovirus TaxID=262968 RepID=Q5YFC9_9VIRU|nr:hypothetical protein ORF136R [Singapore grouper iridovirus]AAS18151.1 unknown [Singapore grouper iridovirus]WAU86845.1 hypothetical protein ORF136R [Singapore grouper iridovirus]